MSPLANATLSEAARAIHQGALSSVDTVRAILSRIEATEPHVLAWAYLPADRVLREASALDDEFASRGPRGLLHGIPIGVKDIVHVEGMKTTAGSALMQDFVAKEDAVVVSRLRQAGALILGKTHTTEFALYDPAPTRNPWNPEHTPGGSSSGSAAAVSAGNCFGAIGTQTLGSILRPAAYCGVVGLKPTYDLVSRTGVLPLAWSMDHVGPITRSVGDARLMLQAMREPDLPFRRAPESPHALRVGIPDRYFLERAQGGIRTAFDSAINQLKERGAQISSVTLPPLFEAGLEAGHIVMRAEIAAYHSDLFSQRRSEYGPRLTELIEFGLRIPSVAYIRAQQVRRAAAMQMRELFGAVDILATPATTGIAPEGLAWTGDPMINGPFTMFGLPAISVPIGSAENRMPVSIQFATDYYCEDVLFGAGAIVECLSPGHPPLAS